MHSINIKVERDGISCLTATFESEKGNDLSSDEGFRWYGKQKRRQIINIIGHTTFTRIKIGFKGIVTCYVRQNGDSTCKKQMTVRTLFIQCTTENISVIFEPRGDINLRPKAEKCDRRSSVPTENVTGYQIVFLYLGAGFWNCGNPTGSLVAQTKWRNPHPETLISM